jgi:DNA polymerase III subunit beta
MTLHAKIPPAPPTATTAPKILARATVELAAFRRMVRLAHQITPRVTAVPVLNCALMTITDGTLNLRATDLDTHLSQSIAADTVAGISLPVRTATLAAFASAASGRVTVELQSDPDGLAPTLLSLRDGDLTLRHRCMMPAEDFPAILTGSGPVLAWEQSPESLHRLIALSRHCISTEETRYYLNGIFLTSKPGASTLRAIATDGHRLACIDSEVQADFATLHAADGTPHSQQPGMIVPRPLVQILHQLTRKGGKDALQVTAQGQLLSIDLPVPGISIIAKTIDGIYPDYTRVIPEASSAITAHLTKAQLTRLHRAAAALEDRYQARPARLDIATRRISVAGGDGNSVSLPLQVTAAEGTAQEPFGYDLRFGLQEGEGILGQKIDCPCEFRMHRNADHYPIRILAGLLAPVFDAPVFDAATAQLDHIDARGPRVEDKCHRKICGRSQWVRVVELLDLALFPSMEATAFNPVAFNPGHRVVSSPLEFHRQRHELREALEDLIRLARCRGIVRLDIENVAAPHVSGPLVAMLDPKRLDAGAVIFAGGRLKARKMQGVEARYQIVEGARNSA